jgi:ectoine hydroxylase-related dioxygenase (phytanoyl-CoA dioxygenase family)
MTTWLSAADCRLADLRALVEQQTDRADYPHAAEVRRNVLIYERGILDADHREARSELARALLDGPGIVVFRGAFDPVVVDRATAVFTTMIEEQKTAGVVAGDHFAKPGANDRIWGALDKFALRDPAAFAAYYDNDTLALISSAWLGRGYQVTSQVNVVNPGGRAQVAHRDYHLGVVPAALAEVPARLRGVPPRRVLRLLRGQLRAAAAGEG